VSRRLVVVGSIAAVAVIALVVGYVAGKSGDDRAQSVATPAAGFLPSPTPSPTITAGGSRDGDGGSATATSNPSAGPDELRRDPGHAVSVRIGAPVVPRKLSQSANACRPRSAAGGPDCDAREPTGQRLL
jgi:hypothetical protein